MTAATVAKKIEPAKTTVGSALNAKASTTGTKVVAEGYTLDMALVMAEFEGDEDAVEELESGIRSGRLRPNMGRSLP
ncbi:hypothetical protein [Arthrobacter sp. BE255]|uniref:hypothetical protein n=1 Tax=Arthrobacter sp. BE255 TaxID=2817721 RepID=UPI002861E03C|nr:hypothetical protein [Arthrobacter sp. BE255]MDR7160932.1 hypothetical protein [Arthrobacter sp. BE255]